jgi:hypothetical protein
MIRLFDLTVQDVIKNIIVECPSFPAAPCCSKISGDSLVQNVS